MVKENLSSVICHLSSTRRGQMKIQQMAFMIIALTIFFVLVGLFVLSTSLQNLKDNKEKLDEENAVALVGKIASFPEFSCENAFGKDLAACVDLDKMMALKRMSNLYTKYWGVSDVEVLLVGSEEFNQCTEENYPNCGILSVFSGNGQGIGRSSFVLACRKEPVGASYYNKCEIAKIIVRVEDVK